MTLHSCFWILFWIFLNTAIFLLQQRSFWIQIFFLLQRWKKFFCKCGNASNWHLSAFLFSLKYQRMLAEIKTSVPLFWFSSGFGELSGNECFCSTRTQCGCNQRWFHKVKFESLGRKGLATLSHGGIKPISTYLRCTQPISATYMPIRTSIKHLRNKK